MSSRASSRRFEIRLFTVGALSAAFLLGAGCGRRDRGARPPDLRAPEATAQRATPPEGGAPTSTGGPAGAGAREGEIVLPGQNRVLPSQDPRNVAASTAPAAGLEESVEEPAAEAAAQAAPEQAAAPGVTPPSSVHPSVLQTSSLPPPVPPGESRFRVQVLATGIPTKAFRLCDELRQSLGIPVYVEPEQGISKVRAGDFLDRAEAETLRRRLSGLGYADAFVVECRGR